MSFRNKYSRNPNKRIRLVTVMGGHKKNEKSPMWGFSLKYLAELMNLGVPQLKRYIKAKKLDPGSLESILQMYLDRKNKGKLDKISWLYNT